MEHGNDYSNFNEQKENKDQWKNLIQEKFRGEFIQKHHQLKQKRFNETSSEASLQPHSENGKIDFKTKPEASITSKFNETQPQQDKERIGLTCKGKPLKSPCTPKGLEYINPKKFMCVGASCVINWKKWK